MGLRICPMAKLIQKFFDTVPVEFVHDPVVAGRADLTSGIKVSRFRLPDGVGGFVDRDHIGQHSLNKCDHDHVASRHPEIGQHAWAKHSAITVCDRRPLRAGQQCLHF